MHVYVDDEPIALDCGCTAYAGDTYIADTIKVWNCDKDKLDKIEITYCSDIEECMGRAYDEKIRRRFYINSKECYLKTSYDKECEKGDMND